MYSCYENVLPAKWNILNTKRTNMMLNKCNKEIPFHLQIPCSLEICIYTDKHYYHRFRENILSPTCG